MDYNINYFREHKSPENNCGELTSICFEKI